MGQTMSAALKILFVIKFISVVLGIFLNTIVIIVRGSKFIRRRKLSPYHFIILQIAIADLTFAILSSFEIETQHQNWNWQHSLSACQFIKPMQATAANVPGLLMLLLAFERYRGITKSLTHHLRIRVIALIALCIWVLTFLAFLPELIAIQIYKKGNCGPNHDIWKKWSPHFRKVYTLLEFTLFWVIPLLGTSFCHCRIYFFIKKHVRIMLAHSQKEMSSINDKRQSQATSDIKMSILQSSTADHSPISIKDNEAFLSNNIDDDGDDNDDGVFRGESNNLQISRIGTSIRRVFRHGSNIRKRLLERFRSARKRTNQKKLKIHMLIAITVAFLVCFFPRHLFFISLAFDLKFDIGKVKTNIHFVASAFIYLHCFINAIIYSLVDMKFRREAFLLFKSIICWKPFYRESFQGASSMETKSSQLQSSVVH